MSRVSELYELLSIDPDARTFAQRARVQELANSLDADWTEIVRSYEDGLLNICEAFLRAVHEATK